MSQVNLLPPELLARQKTRKLTSMIVGLGAILLAFLIGFWFLQGQKLAGVQDDIAAQTATNQQLQTQIDSLADAQALQAEAASKQQLLSEAYAGEVSFSQVLMDLSRVIPSDAYLKTLDATLATGTTAGGTTVGTSTTPGTPGATSFAGAFTVTGGADGFESLASWLTRLESVRGWVNPWLSGATETEAHSGLYDFDSGADLSSEALTARGGGPQAVGNNRRGPIIAGAATAAVLILVTFFLVLPKMGQVKDANASLTDAQSQESTLSSQLAALKQAETDAPKNREIIRKVDTAIPPTVDQQGFILLVQNSAVQSSVDVVTLTPSAPVFDPLTGLSTVTNGISVTGSYFSITEFLFSIETLPRAAKVTAVNITATPSETEPSLLTLTASVDVYTSDSSAGPGSSPGPTSGGTGTTPTGTTTTPSSVTPAAETSGA